MLKIKKHNVDKINKLLFINRRKFYKASVEMGLSVEYILSKTQIKRLRGYK